MTLLELKVCYDCWSEVALFVEIQKLKFNSWNLYFSQTTIRDITQVQGERFGFENGLFLCTIGNAVILDDLNAQIGRGSWSCCKKLTLV